MMKLSLPFYITMTLAAGCGSSDSSNDENNSTGPNINLDNYAAVASSAFSPFWLDQSPIILFDIIQGLENNPTEAFTLECTNSGFVESSISVNFSGPFISNVFVACDDDEGYVLSGNQDFTDYDIQSSGLSDSPIGGYFSVTQDFSAQRIYDTGLETDANGESHISVTSNGNSAAVLEFEFTELNVEFSAPLASPGTTIGVQIEDYTASSTENLLDDSSSITISGLFNLDNTAQPVTVSTVEPIVTGGDDRYMSGYVIADSADGSSVTVEVIAPNTVEVSFDEDGDGSYEVVVQKSRQDIMNDSPISAFSDIL